MRSKSMGPASVAPSDIASRTESCAPSKAQLPKTSVDLGPTDAVITNEPSLRNVISTVSSGVDSFQTPTSVVSGLLAHPTKTMIMALAIPAKPRRFILIGFAGSGAPVDGRVLAHAPLIGRNRREGRF